MSKLIVFALVFVAFTTAYTTIAAAATTATATATKDATRDNFTYKVAVKCTERVHGRNFNFCHSYIAAAQRSRQGIQKLSDLLKQCCIQIKEFKDECRCQAMQEVYLQQKNENGKMEKVRPIIQKLPVQCKIKVNQCQVPPLMV